MNDIFQRERAGEIISLDDPEYGKIAELITEAQKLIAEINTGYRSPQEVRDLFARLTGAPVDPSFWMLPPFYTDFGKNIRVGKNVFMNHGCEFMDRGGITLEDKVLIGPKVNLVTINHPVEPGRRRSTSPLPKASKATKYRWWRSIPPGRLCLLSPPRDSAFPLSPRPPSRARGGEGRRRLLPVFRCRARTVR